MFLNARHGTQTYTNSWWIDRIQSGMQRILEVHSSSYQPSLLQFSGLYCSSYIRKHSSDEKCHRQFAEVLHSCATCARLSVSTSHVKIWSMSSRRLVLVKHGAGWRMYEWQQDLVVDSIQFTFLISHFGRTTEQQTLEAAVFWLVCM